MTREVPSPDRFCIGQIAVRKTDHGFVLSHRDDEASTELSISSDPEAAIGIARYDDNGNYRPLKTAPNLQHGWQLEVLDLNQLRVALDYFYPGRLAVYEAWKDDRLETTTLCDTLNRQSGMYRVAAKISDAQIDSLVGNFCRSDSGCLRTILWKRDAQGKVASTKLSPEKFDTSHDQTGARRSCIPLLCQEMCNLLVAECRKVVKGE